MEMITTFSFLVSIFILLLYKAFQISRRRMYELTKSMAGPPHLPFIGMAHKFLGSLVDTSNYLLSLADLCYRNDGIAKLWIGPFLYIAITNPVDADIVLNNEFNKERSYKFGRVWLGDSIVIADAVKWKHRRKMISPTFNKKIIESYIGIFCEQAKLMVNNMKKEIGKEGEFNVLEYTNQCTLDIVCESMMGIKLGAQDNLNTLYIKAAERQIQLICMKSLHFWLSIKWFFEFTPYAEQERSDIKILHSFTDNIIKSKKVLQEDVHPEYDRPKFKSFLDRLMELSDEGKKLTNVDLREEVDSMTTAGTDTTANALAFTLLLLGCKSEVQENAMDELRDIFGDSNRQPVLEDLSKMEYLDRIIKESLRLFPIVPLIGRSITRETKLSKHTLPAGSNAIVSILGIHKDKAIWGEDAEEFNPDRFLREKIINLHPCSYMPFSAGSRNCLGQLFAIYSMKVIISTILRSYKITSTLDYKTIPVFTALFLKTVNGQLISIEYRKK